MLIIAQKLKDPHSRADVMKVEFVTLEKSLRGGESNPGLPRDRRGYLPLYYHGCLNAVFVGT